MINKVLVIIDTNIINTNSYDGSLGSMYYKIKKHITDEELEKNVHIAIPQIVLDEITTHIKSGYSSSIKNIKKLEQELAKCGKNEITIKTDEAYDPSKKIKTHMVNEKKVYGNIHILGFSKNIKIPNNLYLDALKGKKVFQGHAARSFKDALIVELIMDCKFIDEFDLIYIVTQNYNDFNPYIKRLNKNHRGTFQVVTDPELLLQKISEIFYLEIPKSIRIFVKTDYFKEIVYNYIMSQYPKEKFQPKDLILLTDRIEERAGYEGEDNYFMVKIHTSVKNNKSFKESIFVEIDNSNNILNMNDYDRA